MVLARCPAAAASAARPAALASTVRRRHGRQADDEFAAVVRPLAAGLDGAAVQFDQARTSVRPMPRPPCDRSMERSAWVNKSKTCGSNSRSMPIPSSRIRITTCSPSASAVSQIWPGLLLYLAALFSKLVMTWAMRTGSASIQIGSAGISRSSWLWTRSAAGRFRRRG